MQAIEFKSIVKNHSIPMLESVMLTNGLPVRVVVSFDESETSKLIGKADPDVARFFGCLPNFPERDSQGEYEHRDEL